MPTALQVSKRKVALTTKPKALTQAQYNRAFQNGVRAFELKQASGAIDRDIAARAAAKLWPTPDQTK